MPITTVNHLIQRYFKVHSATVFKVRSLMFHKQGAFYSSFKASAWQITFELQW